MQQTGVTDVIIAAPFTGSVWALSVLVTEVSHRKMEELFEMSFSVTATLLICVWAGGSESQRQSEPKKKKGACLIQAEKSAASIVVVREGEVQFVGAVSTGS